VEAHVVDFTLLLVGGNDEGMQLRMCRTVFMNQAISIGPAYHNNNDVTIYWYLNYTNARLPINT
jgi:hypothetical protein